MAMGVPGWPELACCTASMDRVRMVLTQSWSIGLAAAAGPRLPGVPVAGAAATALDMVSSRVGGLGQAPGVRGIMITRRPAGGPTKNPFRHDPNEVVEIEPTTCGKIGSTRGARPG